MKAIRALKKKRWDKERTLNPYISEANHRKRAQADFKTEMELIGTELRRLRMEKGYSPDVVAKALKIPKGRLHKIECGTYPHFDVPQLYNLSDHYGASPSAILSVIPNTNFSNMD